MSKHSLTICALFTTLVTCPVASASLTLTEYEETRLNHPTFSHSVGPSPAPFTVTTAESSGYDGFGGFELVASYSVEDFTKLRTTASINASGAVDDDPLTWNTVTATATAESDITTFGFVEGFGAATSGTIDLFWSVDGETNITLDTDAGVSLNASVLTQLTTPLTAVPLLDEFHVNPGSYPAASSVVTVTVPWEAGSEVVIPYKLMSTVTMNASNGSTPPGGFFLDASAQFGNTVVLMVDDFVIRDSNLNPINGASFTVTAVPEPSAFVLLGAIGLGLISAQRLRNT